VKRGEVRWAEHPDWPRRPALVLTRNEAIDHLNELFVVLATTNIRGLPTEVELGPADGMPRACVLNADHVASLPKGGNGPSPGALRRRPERPGGGQFDALQRVRIGDRPADRTNLPRRVVVTVQPALVVAIA
jgi:mRNA-degrading endonuclease toxin of MazEF toxin-antitoxin module